MSQAQVLLLHDYNIAVKAALTGQGIAMGHPRLISPPLASGALVQELPDTIIDDPRIGWWFVTPKAVMSDVATVFRDWLTQLAAQDPLGSPQ